MTTSYKRITESIEELLGKSHYMVAKSQMDGNLTFDGHTKTVEETDNESRCRSLCLRIERALEACREEEIPALLEMYDLLHRIGYGKMPDQRFLATQRNRVYAAWRSGNRNIQESQIYSLLKKSINARALCTHMLRDWLRILIKHNRFPNVTTHENYQRLAIVMRENIDTLIKDINTTIHNSETIQLQAKDIKDILVKDRNMAGQAINILIRDRRIMSENSYGKSAKELKRKWYRANRVADLTTLSTPLLKSYRSFTNSLFPTILGYEAHQLLDTAIIEELTSRDDFNHYEYKAFDMTLTHSKTIFKIN